MAFSTLGLKEGEDLLNAILMLVWCYTHFRMRTPVLLHENVSGFTSDNLKDEAFKHGYEHFQVRAKPMDVGVHVGRGRKYLAGIMCSILGLLLASTRYIYEQRTNSELAVRALVVSGGVFQASSLSRKILYISIMASLLLTILGILFHMMILSST